MTKKIALTLLMINLFGVSALAEKPKHQIMKEKTTEAVDATIDYSKEQKDKFQKEMETSLSEISDKITELKKQAGKKTDETQDDIKAQIKELEAKQKKLSNDLKKLSHQTGKAWSQLKDGMSSAWKDLSESYEKAKNEYK